MAKCVKCKKPIKDGLTRCPFCRAVQPVTTKTKPQNVSQSIKLPNNPQQSFPENNIQPVEEMKEISTNLGDTVVMNRNIRCFEEYRPTETDETRSAEPQVMNVSDNETENLPMESQANQNYSAKGSQSVAQPVQQNVTPETEETLKENARPYKELNEGIRDKDISYDEPVNTEKSNTVDTSALVDEHVPKETNTLDRAVPEQINPVTDIADAMSVNVPDTEPIVEESTIPDNVSGETNDEYIDKTYYEDVPPADVVPYKKPIIQKVLVTLAIIVSLLTGAGFLLYYI